MYPLCKIMISLAFQVRAPCQGVHVVHTVSEAGGSGCFADTNIAPCLQEIVQEVDVEQRLLRIAAPKGLLALGRQKAALRYLEPLLRVRHRLLSVRNTQPSSSLIHVSDCSLIAFRPSQWTMRTQ